MTIPEMISDFDAYLGRSPKAESTKLNYRSTARVFSEYCLKRGIRDLDHLRPEDCISFLRRRECAPDTMRSEMTRLKFMLSRCVENRVLEFNPFKHSDVRDIRPASRPRERYFDPEQLEQFLGAVQGEYGDYFLLLSETGLRKTEGLRLRYCDYYTHKQGQSYLKVEARPGWKPKTRRSARMVPLTQKADNVLLVRIQGHTGSQSDEIWPSGWTGRSVSRAFDFALKLAGLDGEDEQGEKLVVHSLRHSFATRLARKAVAQNEPLSAVRDVLGHATYKMLDTYWHSSNDERFGVMRGM